MITFMMHICYNVYLRWECMKWLNKNGNVTYFLIHCFWVFFSSRHSFLLPESLQHLHVHSVNGYSNVDHFNLDQIIQNFRLSNWFSVVLIPLENIFLIWRRYYCRWRAEKFGFCSSLIASEQGGNFFIVLCLLWHRASGQIQRTAQFNRHLR